MKRKYRLAKIKKEIKDFLLSEEGKITKKNIAKIGLSLAVLSAMFPPSEIAAGHGSSLFGPSTDPGGEGRSGHSSHTSHGSHGSHSSHGSHGQW